MRVYLPPFMVSVLNILTMNMFIRCVHLTNAPREVSPVVQRLGLDLGVSGLDQIIADIRA